jgi:hypothetical protein
MGQDKSNELAQVSATKGRINSLYEEVCMEQVAEWPLALIPGLFLETFVFHNPRWYKCQFGTHWAAGIGGEKSLGSSAVE